MDYSHFFSSDDLFHPPPVPTTTTSTITITSMTMTPPVTPPPPQTDYPYQLNFMFPPPFPNHINYPMMLPPQPQPQPVGHSWGGGTNGMYTNKLMGGTAAAAAGAGAITGGVGGEQVFRMTLDPNACVRDLGQRRPEKEPMSGSGSAQKKGMKRRNSGGGGRERRQATNTSSLGNADDGGPSYGGRRTVAVATSSRFLTDIPSTLTVDGTTLRFVLRKELRNSDVSNLSRIILPKRDAEAFLPFLAIKEGMQINLKDVFSSDIWKMRYRYWPNNKSRMYVLENTAGFIRKNELTTGDYMAIYEDNNKQLFICAMKAANPPPAFVPGAPIVNAANEQPEMAVAAPPQQQLVNQECYIPYPIAAMNSGEGAPSSNDSLRQTDNKSKDPAAIMDFSEYDFSVLDSFTYFDDPDIPPYDFNQQ